MNSRQLLETASKKIADLERRIERMKCCGNCEHFSMSTGSKKCRGCKYSNYCGGDDNWEACK